MAKNKEIKTNAMRLLETKKIPYEAHTYECDEFVDGIQIADMLGLPHEKVYKTLVTQGNSKNYFVFVIPIEGYEKGSKIRRREVGRHASCKRYQCSNRLYPWRLYCDWNEETVCDQN